MERSIREQFSDMAVVLSIKEPGTKGFAELYAEMLQFLYNLDGLYTVLSTDYMDKTRGLSIPFALKPNGQPSIYVFTDIELAKKWCRHYRHFYDGDKEPIGYLKKSDMEFLNIFQIAYQLGIYKCIVNEGDRLLSLNIADMIKINNLNQSNMILNVETIESYLIQHKQPKLMVRFNSIEILDFEIKKEDLEYLNDIRDKAFDEFSAEVKKLGGTAVNKGRHFENAGHKLATIFFDTNSDLLNAYKNKHNLLIEKTFFETVSKYDTKKLLDSRYSYIKLESKEKYPDIDEYFK